MFGPSTQDSTQGPSKYLWRAL